MFCSWFSRLGCFGGAERASSSYPRKSPSRDNVVIMWGKQRLGTKMARLDKQQVLGLGLEVIFRRTEGQGSDGLRTLSLHPPPPIFSPSTLICVLVSLSLLMGRRGEKRRPNQTANSFGRRELSTALPRLARVPLIHLSRGTTLMHSEGGREALSHNCTRWSN